MSEVSFLTQSFSSDIDATSQLFFIVLAYSKTSIFVQNKYTNMLGCHTKFTTLIICRRIYINVHMSHKRNFQAKGFFVLLADKCFFPPSLQLGNIKVE